MENIGTLENLWSVIIANESLYHNFADDSEENQQFCHEIDNLNLTYDQHEALFWAYANAAGVRELCGFVNGFRLAMALTAR